MTTTVETLGRAAAKLRELATAAPSGPKRRWHAVENSDGQAFVYGDAFEAEVEVRRDGDSFTIDMKRQLLTAQYIAVMSPLVGLAIADWLDLAAGTAEFAEQWNLPNTNRHPLAVARAVLGEQP